MKQLFKIGMSVVYCSFLSTSLVGQDLDGTPVTNKLLSESLRSGNDTNMASIYKPNLFDGSLDIKIPFYEYKVNGVDYGVALSYNTRGVRLDEYSSVAGLHFNLMADFSISRVVKGLPDELAVTFDDTVSYNNSQKLYAARGRLAAVLDYSTLPAGVYRDEESDEFTVTLPGRSFSFYIGRNGQIFTVPQNGVSVTILSNGNPYWVSPPPESGTLQFLITDEVGNKYYFKKGDYSFRWLYIDAIAAGTSPGRQVGGYNIVDKWVIEKVVIADGRQLNYNYTLGTGAANAMYRACTFADFPNLPGGAELTGSDYRARLQSIRYPNGITANLIYDNSKGRCDLGGAPTIPDSSILTEVNITSNNGSCIRYKLHQVYVVADPANLNYEMPISYPCRNIYDAPYTPGQTGPMPTYRNHRLRLKKITIMSCNGQKEEPFYSFDYDSQGLPPRFRGGQDWYGFWNGKQPVWPFTSYAYDPDLSIPLHTENRHGILTTYGVDREPRWPYTKAGSLASITNAYGGKTRFVYASPSVSNNYSSYDNNKPNDSYFFGYSSAADGIVIDSIIESENYRPLDKKITTFQYFNGLTWFSGAYYHYPKTQADYNQWPAAPCIFTSSRLTSGQLVKGSNHGYGSVRMYIHNSDGRQLSRMESTFSTIYDASNNWQYRYFVCGGGKKYYQYPFTDKQYLRDWEIGLPITTTVYDDRGFIVQSISNQYKFDIDTTSAVAKQVDGTHSSYLDVPVPNQPTTKVKLSDYYKPFRGTSQLLSTVTRKYVSNTDYIQDSTFFVYDSHNNLKRIGTLNSEGEEVQTINYYNYDAGVLDPIPGLERLVTSQQWKRAPGTTGPLPENGLLLDGFFNGLSRQGVSTNFSNIRAKNIYTLRSQDPPSYSAYLGTGSDNSIALKIQAAFANSPLTGFDKREEVLLTDNKGNPLETFDEKAKQYKAVLWDTATGQKLAEATSCRFNDIAYAGFEAKGATNLQYSSSAVIESNDAIGGNHIYNLGGSATIARSGLTPGKSYWISFWSTHMPTCTLGGASVTLRQGPSKGLWTYYEAEFTPSSVADNLVLSRSQACFIDEVRLAPTTALMQSWNTDPLLGTTSATDGRGLITYYEYDVMGRPYLVRDQDGHIISKTQHTINGAD